MITIHVNPARVEMVVLTAESDVERDFTIAAWCVVGPLVKEMDKRLREAVESLLSNME